VTAGQEGYDASVTAVVFSAARGNVPVANDFLFADASTSDGTASTDDTSPPVTTAINDLAGFSNTSSIDIPFSGSLDSSTVVAGSSVFLIELKNKEYDSSIDALDLTTILAAFPDAPFSDGYGTADGDQLTPGLHYEAEYVEMDDGATPTIRIHPLKPLDPISKYLVVITDQLKDVDGVTVVSSSEYAHTSGDDELVSTALSAVRTAIQGWEALSGAFLSAVTGAVQTQDNIILSYAFTTGSGPDILKQYAAPSLFYVDNLELATAEALLEASSTGSTDYIAGLIATAAGLDSSDATILAAMKLTDAYASAVYSQIAAAGLDSAVNRPSPRDVDLIDSASVDAAIGGDGASPATFLGTTDSYTRYIQGQIQLPDFLGSATLTTEFTADGITDAMSSDPTWTASVAAATALGTTVPTDTDDTTNVTYRFPFPAAVGTNYSPVMITLPAEIDYGYGTCAAPFKVVMYVHGITGARTNGLAYSAGLAANCIATVAIDLPLHGIAPLVTNSNGESADNGALPFVVEPGLATFTSSPYAAIAAMSTPTFDNLTEQHDSISQNDTGIRHAMDFDGSLTVEGTDGTTSSGKSGSTQINLFNFTRSRDNIQQAVVDLLNLNASLGNIDTALGGSQLDLDQVFVAGHSLGAIFATTYSAVNNDPEVLAANTNLNQIQGVILANGGSHISKLLENSPSFGPTILGSLAGSGLTQGSSDLEKYLSVMQASLDSIDPAMSGSLLAETDTPIVLFNMVGGDALPTDSTELAAISYPDGFKALGSFLPDHTVPNFDYFADADTNPYSVFATALGLQEEAPTAKSVMAGTDGLASIMGLEVVNADTDLSGLASPTQVVTRLSTGTHSTFANSDAPAAFTEMLTQSIYLINGSFTVGDTTVLESSN
jgi:pimeloyl-ACP methyl ester carboxylesterase